MSSGLRNCLTEINASIAAGLRLAFSSVIPCLIGVFLHRAVLKVKDEFFLLVPILSLAAPKKFIGV